MAVATSTVLTVASLAATAVGAGVSYYGAQKQAAAQERAAAYNAAVQRNNAITQQRQIERNAAIARNNAQSQAAWLAYEQQIQRNNAISLRDTAAANQRESRENVRRERDKKRRILGQMKAQMASSGLNIGEGTPVDILAESSGILEMDILEISRQAEIRFQQLNYQAELTEAGADKTGVEIALAGQRQQDAKYQFSTGRYVAAIGKAQSAMTLLSGKNNASATRTAATAQAFGTIGSSVASFN